MIGSLLLCACAGSDSESAPPVRPEGEFIGVSADGRVSLAILATNEQVVAYACNDAEIGSWFEGKIADRSLKSARNETLTLSSSSTGWSAELRTVDGTTRTFSTVRPQSGEGLFMLASDGSPVATTGVDRTGQVVLDAQQRAVIKADAASAGQGFRIGWVVGPSGAFRGNLSSKNVNKPPTGVPVPISAPVVQRATVPGGIVLGGLKEKKTVDEAGSLPAVPTSNPCADIDFSPTSCCNAIRFNSMLISLSNTFTELGVESDTLDQMLNECSNNLTTLCPNNAASACDAR